MTTPNPIPRKYASAHGIFFEKMTKIILVRSGKYPREGARAPSDALGGIVEPQI